MIHIVGNSHISTMAGNLDHHNSRKEEYVIDDIHYIWNLNITCWNMSEQSIKDLQDMIGHTNPDDVIIFSYGSFDIRNHLVFHKNARFVARKYYNLITKMFADYNCLVYFMDPVPPLDDSQPEYHIQQMQEHLIFIDELDRLSSNRIKMNDIFEEGLSSANLLDLYHLNPESNQRIIEYLKNRGI